MKHYNTLKSSRIMVTIVVVAMTKVRSKRFTILLLMTLLAISLFTVFPVSAKYKAGKEMKTASVTYIGNEPDGLDTEWTYFVESGNGGATIRYWKLHSTAFKYFDVVYSSETVIQKATFLKFPTSYSNDQIREVWFILGDEYAPIEEGRVRYVIKGSFAMPGKTRGPVMPRP